MSPMLAAQGATPRATAPAAPGVARPGRVLAVLSVAVFLVHLDLSIVNVAMPDLARDFAHASLADLSWVLNAYAIVFAALLVPAGRLADRLGRRRTYIGGVVLFTLASGLCGLAPSVTTLVAARVLQAAGAALLLPSSLALLLPAFPPERRPVAIGVWAAVGGTAAAAGPLLGGMLVEASWRLVFLVNVPFGILGALLSARVLTEARASGVVRPDLLGTTLLVGAVALLALGLVQAPDWGWDDAATVGCLAAAAVGLVAFVARSARHPAPVIELALLRVRSFAMASLAGLLFTAAFTAMLLSNVLFLTEVWRWSVLHAGLALAPGPLCAALASPAAGALAARVGQRWVAAAGALLFAAASALRALGMEERAVYASVLLPAMAIGGIGIGTALATLTSAASGSLPAARLATGTGAFVMVRQVGGVVGVAALVALLSEPAPHEALAAFRDGWWFQAATAAAAAVAALAIGRVDAATAGARTTVDAPSAAAPGARE